MDHPLGHERERESGFHHRWERLVPEGILQLGRKRMFLDRQNGIKTGMLRPVTAFHFIDLLIIIYFLTLFHSNFKVNEIHDLIMHEHPDQILSSYE